VEISSSLLSWFNLEKRDLPFRKNRNPYRIWVSEIMLQQTKVETVIPYYHKWIRTYPDILSVYNSNESSLLKSWEGLGYYSRCRNFHKAAKIVCEKYNAKIPDSWEIFRSLPGVGDYTAGAVLSIAFKKPFIALDGNVKRVMARILGRKKLSKHNIQRFILTLKKWLDHNRPGDFNEAMMELGACICTTRSPKCHKCPISNFCAAYKSGNPMSYPQKNKKKKIPNHIFVASLIKEKNKILIQRRQSNMLNGLWEIPNKHVNNIKYINDELKKYIYEQYGFQIKVKSKVGTISHSYSHFNMKLILLECKKIGRIKNYNQTYDWIKKSEVINYAFHKVNHKIFKLLDNYF